MIDEPCTHRVEHDVSRHRKQIRFFFNDKRFVATLKQVTDPTMACMKPLRVVPVEIAHGGGEICVGCFNEQVKVVIHEAIRMNNKVVQLHGIFQPIEKAASIFIVEEDVLFIVSTNNDVVQGAFIEDAEGSRHRMSLYQNSRFPT